jgi:hypothetical protein
LISLQGRPVEALPETYNFNYWSGSIAFWIPLLASLCLCIFLKIPYC